MLWFKAIYRDAILTGTKTTTIRAWHTRRCRAGRIYQTNLGIRLLIESVERIALADITDEIARADGLRDRADVVRALRDCYAVLPETLTLVRFSPA